MTERANCEAGFSRSGLLTAHRRWPARTAIWLSDKETAYKCRKPLRFGMGRMEMCGALSGAFRRCVGMKNSAGADTGTTKGQTYKVTKMLKEKFEQKNGAYLCRDLKGVADGNVRRSCPGCIEDACELIEEYLTK